MRTAAGLMKQPIICSSSSPSRLANGTPTTMSSWPAGRLSTAANAARHATNIVTERCWHQFASRPVSSAGTANRCQATRAWPAPAAGAGSSAAAGAATRRSRQ